MTIDYTAFSEFSDEDRRDAFARAAAEVGTQPHNVEKDYWICAVLGCLFEEPTPKDWPLLAFRGGTSLSKAYNRIRRFSEDIDIAISRPSLGESISLDELEALSPTKRRERLDKIETTGARFVDKVARKRISARLEALGQDGSKVSLDPLDKLTLRAPYAPIVLPRDPYILPTVRIEFTVRAALKPVEARTITPYVTQASSDAPYRMQVRGVRTIQPSRTFWDKVLITHEINQRHLQKKSLPDENQRISRHYYDLWRLLKDNVVPFNDTQLRRLEDCRRHSQLFYGDEGIDLSGARPGTLNIVPHKDLWPDLKADYGQMQVMVFEPMPNFSDMMAFLKTKQDELNALTASKVGAK